MKITVSRGLTEKEYNAIKAEVKDMFGSSASTRFHKQQYAYGQVDILATKRIGYQFTEEQFMSIKSLMDRHGLIIQNMDILNGASAYYCFNRGVHYMTKVC